MTNCKRRSLGLVMLLGGFGLVTTMWVALAADPTPAPLPKPAAKQPPLRQLRVYYATNRKQVVTKDGRMSFGVKHGPVRWGHSDVAIGRDHKAGQLKAVKVRSIQPLNDIDAVRADIGQHAGIGNRNILIFVHGFNYAFEDSLTRVAQLAHDCDYQGTLLVFNWPSLCQLTKDAYDDDRKALDASVKDFAQVLIDVNRKFPGANIQIVAHSLGGRLVGKTAVEIAQTGQRIRLNNVILAAPDVDVESFQKSYARPLTEIANRVTVYHSRSDTVLMFARAYNGDRDRLGLSGLVRTEKRRIETVDYSALGGFLQAHNFYREHPALVKDLRGVLTGRMPRSHRQLLTPLVASAATQ